MTHDKVHLNQSVFEKLLPCVPFSNISGEVGVFFFVITHLPPERFSWLQCYGRNGAKYRSPENRQCIKGRILALCSRQLCKTNTLQATMS